MYLAPCTGADKYGLSSASWYQIPRTDYKACDGKTHEEIAFEASPSMLRNDSLRRLWLSLCVWYWMDLWQ